MFLDNDGGTLIISGWFLFMQASNNI